jgi:hypothetical protein
VINSQTADYTDLLTKICGICADAFFRAYNPEFRSSKSAMALSFCNILWLQLVSRPIITALFPQIELMAQLGTITASARHAFVSPSLRQKSINCLIR